MFTKNEQFADANKQYVDFACDFVNSSLAGLDKLTKIQMDASKQILDKASSVAKKIIEFESPNDMFRELNTFASQVVDCNADNCREAYAVIQDTQEHLTKVIKSNMGNLWSNTVFNGFDEFSRGNISPSKMFSDYINSWVNNANQAINTMNKVASEVSEITKNNIKATTGANTSFSKKSGSSK